MNKFDENKGRLARIPKEQHKAISSKGGVASGEARRRRRDMVEFGKVVMSVWLQQDASRFKSGARKKTIKRKKTKKKGL